uniref:Uncharacterized protein n=1 Tax=Arion vulgaris TaxID=1028688 RepID=A0A0B7B3K0_9EUPU
MTRKHLLHLLPERVVSARCPVEVGFFSANKPCQPNLNSVQKKNQEVKTASMMLIT